MISLRALAAHVIHQVTEGQSLADCLDPVLLTLTDARDRAFVQALCYGVCRFYTRLDVILSYLLKKPLKAKESEVHALLLVGLYQLMDMRVPPHAAVAETVNATDKLHKPWARGLVNAVLREYLRHQEQIAVKLETDLEAHYAHPEWWILTTKTAWPENWQEILTANNQHPPFAIRVNLQQQSREEYLAVLHAAGHGAAIIPETLAGVILESAIPVTELPGFAQGAVFVQDGAAQLAAPLLNLTAGLRVLDACAAPGGKLTQILETAPDLAHVTAVESDYKRMGLIKENLARLHLTADCICDDAGVPASWWDGILFDRILLDAPCSASGVIRRHPDIKLLREPTDIALLAQEQLRLLSALWPLLKRGGLFVYATCSFFPAENGAVSKAFLAEFSDATEEKIIEDWGVPCEIGRQILPGMHQMDGFYYARFRKG